MSNSQSKRYVIVQPMLEPNPEWTRKVGSLMVFIYVRWSSWGIGIEVMSAGAAVQIGPIMFGACHISDQLDAFEAERQRLVSIEGDSL